MHLGERKNKQKGDIHFRSVNIKRNRKHWKEIRE